jgi:hypothetical protein
MAVREVCGFNVKEYGRKGEDEMKVELDGAVRKFPGVIESQTRVSVDVWKSKVDVRGPSKQSRYDTCT